MPTYVLMPALLHVCVKHPIIATGRLDRIFHLPMLYLSSRAFPFAAGSAAEQVFRCPTEWCRREATPLDSFKLIKADGQFHCDVCDAVMEAELGGGSLGGQGEHAQRRAAAQKLLVSA